MSRSPKEARLAATSSPSVQSRARLAHALLQLDEALHLGQEPGRDAGDPLQLAGGHAAAEQREEPPEPRVGRLQEAPAAGPPGVVGRRPGPASLSRPVPSTRSSSGPASGRSSEPGMGACSPARPPDAQPASTSSVRRPGGVLGQEAGARLLQAAERLVERRAERAVDGHDLAGRLHLRAQRAVGAGELVEREARQLDDHVVERRLEGGHGGARDGVGDLVQAPADGDLGGHPGDGVAGRLGGQRRRAADARVDLDDGVLARRPARARTGRCSRPPRRAPG